MTERQKRRRLTAQRKFQVYLDTRGPDAPVGEVLRKNRLTLEDLRDIEGAGESWPPRQPSFSPVNHRRTECRGPSSSLLSALPATCVPRAIRGPFTRVARHYR